MLLNNRVLPFLLHQYSISYFGLEHGVLFLGALTDLSRDSIDIVEIDEPCAHEIQFGGLCAECGKDMTE